MSDFTRLDDWCLPLSDNRYITTKPVIWEVAVEGSGWFITIPKGFIFDVSIPKYLRWILSPGNPKYRGAGCVHDYVLEMGWDWVRAAAEFNLVLKVSKVDLRVRLAMFLAVVLYKYS